MKNDNQCERPCGTCPWLAKNFNKPNPPGFNQIKAEAKANGDKSKYHDWYSLENLKRLWSKGLRHGEKMICHSADPNAADYGGVNAKVEPKICLGAAIIAFLHIKHIESLIKKNLSPAMVQKLYKTKSDYPMSKHGQISWAFDISIGAVTNDYGMPTKTKIPRVIDSEAIQSIKLPWRDEIVNGGKDA